MLLLLFVMTFCYNADLISCALHYVFCTKRVITKRHEPIGFQVDENNTIAKNKDNKIAVWP